MQQKLYQPLRNCSWGCARRKKGPVPGWEAEKQNLTQGGSWSLQQFCNTHRASWFLLSGWGPGSPPLAEGLGREDHLRVDASCMESRLFEVHMFAVVTGVQRLPCCRGRGAASASAHEPQGPRLLQTGLFQAAKEGGPPELAASNPNGLEGCNGLTSPLPGQQERQSTCGLASDGETR